MPMGLSGMTPSIRTTVQRESEDARKLQPESFTSKQNGQEGEGKGNFEDGTGNGLPNP
jgi:hypothetical protein